MTTCKYCGGVTKLDLERCPHCGGDMLENLQQEIKIENKKSFPIRSKYVLSYVLIRNLLVFIVVPFFVVPFVFAILIAISSANSAGKPNIAIMMLMVFLMMVSIPGSFVLLFRNYMKKANRTYCLVTDKQLECVTAGGLKINIPLSDIMRIEGEETKLQKRYKIGDVKIVVKQGDIANMVVLKDIEDFTNSYTRLKSFIGSK